MRRNSLLIVTSVTVTFAALSAAVAAFWMARQFYLDRAELRLNPVHSTTYANENAVLAAPSLPRLVFFGDSRVTGWLPQPRLPQMELVWRGIDGETTAQMVHRFGSDALALKPTAIVIQAGINDLVVGAALGRDDNTRDVVTRNIATMAAAAGERGIDVYLLTIIRPAQPPLWRRPVWSKSIYRSVAQANDVLRGLASDDVHVIDGDELLAQGSQALPERFARDTLHFNDAAYQVLNDALTQRMQTVNAVQ